MKGRLFRIFFLNYTCYILFKNTKTHLFRHFSFFISTLLRFFPHQNQCIFVPVAPSEYIALSLQPKSSPYRSMMLFLHHYNYLLHLSIIIYFSLVFSVYMFSPYRISFNLPFFLECTVSIMTRAHVCLCVYVSHNKSFQPYRLIHRTDSIPY